MEQVEQPCSAGVGAGSQRWLPGETRGHHGCLPVFVVGCVVIKRKQSWVGPYEQGSENDADTEVGCKCLSLKTQAACCCPVVHAVAGRVSSALCLGPSVLARHRC
jgi:hypothetical protein